MDGDDEVPPDELERLYSSTLRRVAAMPELPMRRSAVREAVEALPAEQAVWFLDQLIRGGLWGRQDEVDALTAAVTWLLRAQSDAAHYSLFQALFEAAYAQQRRAVILMLRTVPPHKALPKGRKLPEVRLPFSREVTVGERRQIAASGKRELLERLLHDPNPLVLAKVLANPMVRERDVLAMASRRPHAATLLHEVAIADRWIALHTVREALVLNPFVATDVALKLLPTLRIDALRPIRHAGDIHPALVEAAAIFVELREQRTAPWRV